jgi:hypothetical protein
VVEHVDDEVKFGGNLGGMSHRNRIHHLIIGVLKNTLKMTKQRRLLKFGAYCNILRKLCSKAKTRKIV